MLRGVESNYSLELHRSILSTSSQSTAAYLRRIFSSKIQLFFLPPNSERIKVHEKIFRHLGFETCNSSKLPDWLSEWTVQPAAVQWRRTIWQKINHFSIFRNLDSDMAEETVVHLDKPQYLNSLSWIFIGSTSTSRSQSTAPYLKRTIQ